MERKMKQLIVAISGIGLCISGSMIDTWVIATGKDGGVIQEPFGIVGKILIVVGTICLVGALLCQTGRYDKK